MVSGRMVGITELMTDANFLGWIEKQENKLLVSLNTLDIYNLYVAQLKAA